DTAKTQNIPSVSFSPASHKAQSFPSVPKTTSLQFLKSACPDAHGYTKDIIHSSMGSTLKDVKPQRNGFVHTVLECYNQHHALTIRPDDVWLAILTQFSCFVSGNAEALRSLFVLHDGKKELSMEVKQKEGKVDWDLVVQMLVETMNAKIQENVIDPELRQWIIPAFSTTNDNDRLVAGMVMMATVKEYFSFRICLLCGIPRVTLQGEKDDWVYILNRIEKLKEFGPQTTAWYRLLHPILSRFVKAFDKPNSRKNLEFWSKVAHFESLGSGPMWLSGWITAFMAFNEKGQWKGDSQHDNEYGNVLVLDGVRYPRLDSDKVPAGYAQVDVTLEIKQKDYPTALIAGSVGTEIFSSGDKSLSDKGKRDSARPALGWWWVFKKE
ncbi:hypothetical protein SCLCIDRAFT_90807, partial [Scleroderma citrinum Foug A]